MDFRSTYQPPKASFNINHQEKTLLIGSCFSQNIGNRLKQQKFQTLINPYGILYNPISIFDCLEEIVSKKEYQAANIDVHNSIFHSKNHHSDFSALAENEIIQNINISIEKAHHFLKQAKHIIITFGTAWVYEYDGKIVGNCHKMPNHLFEKRILSVEEIVLQAKKAIHSLRVFNPDLKFIFTLSPVRHLKDGFEENQVSKSILRLAIDKMIKENTSTHYFPAYELVLDDLRDYRFYKQDRVHPTEEAVDYVWNKFSDSFFTEQTKSLNTEIEKINQALAHRPQFEESEAHQDFLHKLNERIARFEKENGISF
ncbi:MAG: GSCFA domain-containing protein [Chitinophagales bacterium]